MQSSLLRWGIAAILLLLLSQLSFAHGMSEADKQAIIEGGNLIYLWLGVTHMLTGYDHLLFVFGIIFFLTSFKEIAKYITAFTVGHSITLIYATFNAIQLNYFLIDAIIGLSVCYIAFSNLDGFRKYLNINPPHMMLMIIGLGLIHGFGLSTRLQELPLSEDQLLLNIISFNVGIELGQISALAVMLVLMTAWRKRPSFAPFSLASNYGLIIAGALLFLMQMYGYSQSGGELEEEKLTASNRYQTPGTSKNMFFSKDESWADSVEIVLPGRGEKEYKLAMEKGAGLEYQWDSQGKNLYFDFHGEPKGDDSGYFKSYRNGTEKQAGGHLITSFSGTHGWYWKNNHNFPVTIKLNFRGDYQRIDLISDQQTSLANAKPENATPSQQRHESID